MTAALAKPDGIRKTIFLAPVLDMSIERTLKRYGSDPDSDINLDGISKLRVLMDSLELYLESIGLNAKNKTI